MKIINLPRVFYQKQKKNYSRKEGRFFSHNVHELLDVLDKVVGDLEEVDFGPEEVAFLQSQDQFQCQLGDVVSPTEHLQGSKAKKCAKKKCQIEN